MDINTYKVLGLISGSSMDGLDVAYCIISEDNGRWSFAIRHAECVPFPKKWQLRLRNLVMQNAITYIKTHTYFGHYMGEVVNDFVLRYQLEGQIDFIASHGQTIFHQPENMLTSQIGDGAALAAKTGLPVISDFRTVDVALGGQGAPIVPVGDKYFFSDYTFCLNLGGIANISMRRGNGSMIGYDLCAANLVLNQLAGRLGMPFDDKGENSRMGEVDEQLYDELNRSWYYDKKFPKTLGGGWVRKVLMPLFRHYPIPIEDQLRTYVEHSTRQIAKEIDELGRMEGLDELSGHKMLVTGGGAFNEYFMERLADKTSVELVRPTDELVNFKEALVIALMGILRQRNEINCLATVTGASKDSIGGIQYA